MGNRSYLIVKQDSISSMICDGLKEVVPMSAKRASVVQVSVYEQKDLDTVEGHEPKAQSN